MKRKELFKVPFGLILYISTAILMTWAIFSLVGYFEHRRLFLDSSAILSVGGYFYLFSLFLVRAQGRLIDEYTCGYYHTFCRYSHQYTYLKIDNGKRTKILCKSCQEILRPRFKIFSKTLYPSRLVGSEPDERENVRLFLAKPILPLLKQK